MAKRGKKTGSPESPKWLITLITGDKQFYRTLDSILEQLKAKKAEFNAVGLCRIAPDRNTNWLKKLNSRVLQRTFVLFCEKDHVWDLIDKLKKQKSTIPVFAILDSYQVRAIDNVFGMGYFYTRGVVSRTVGDPEDLGPLTRAIKEEFRKKLTLEGKLTTKKVGWKIQVSSEDREQRRLVSLFLDPVMREFMQRLIFTVQSIEVEMPERPFEEHDLRELFQQIDNARKQEALQADKEPVHERAHRCLAKKNLVEKPKPILLEGETGVGKTVIAEWIHRYLSSDRSHSVPFERISTVNIGTDVLEAELFGVIPGTFTDAVPGPGRLLLAWGGVVFLDEIGDLPPEIQAKFLVYLDELEFKPSGWPYSWKVFAPVYVIAATNKDLKQAIEAGTFRRDLYHRFPYKLRVPSLRERRSDLRPLIDLVLQDPAINTDRWVEEISLGAIDRLETYDFPGNFRELESILARAVFRAKQAGRRAILEEDVEI
jgi:transcriptional regulator with PAS, ATPase and Fis domain